MRKIILMILLLMPLCAIAQKSESTKVIKVRRSNDCFGIELPNLNVMYLSIENPFRVIYSGSGKLKVKLSNGVATDMGEGRFIARFNEGIETVISVYEINGKKEKALGTKVYRLKPVPQPTPMIAGIESGGVISKALLIAANGIGVVLKEFLYDVRYEVVSYSLSINVAGEFKSVSAYGAVYSPEGISLLYKLKNNTRIIFEDIRVRIKGSSKIASIAPLVLKVSG
jgi:hypothetical protein